MHYDRRLKIISKGVQDTFERNPHIFLTVNVSKSPSPFQSESESMTRCSPLTCADCNLADMYWQVYIFASFRLGISDIYRQCSFGQATGTLLDHSLMKAKIFILIRQWENPCELLVCTRHSIDSVCIFCSSFWSGEFQFTHHMTKSIYSISVPSRKY